MNKKLVYTFISIILIVAIICFNVHLNNKDKDYEVEEIAQEEILDECTEEYEYIQNEKLAKVNSSQEKISPECEMILKKIYTKCNHTIEEQIELPQELVNMNEEDLKNEYTDWNIEKFSTDEIILSQKINEECGEHYVLKNHDGLIAIYQINENGEEEFLDETEISTEYLTQTDLIEIQNGLKVNGLEELNKILEDYE